MPVASVVARCNVTLKIYYMDAHSVSGEELLGRLLSFMLLLLCVYIWYRALVTLHFLLSLHILLSSYPYYIWCGQLAGSSNPNTPLQADEIPISLVCFLCFGHAKDLVRTSAV